MTKDACKTPRAWTLFLGCLLALSAGLILVFLVRGPAQPVMESHSRAAGMLFAVADFDGDWKPDLAVREVDGRPSLRTRYSIRVKLGAGEELTFAVNAPFGGVRVAARDVNGDKLLDVVVTAVLEERVVAVLLNQGHGQFSEAEPEAYSAFAKEPDFFLRGIDASPCDKLTVVSVRHSFEGERVGCSPSSIVLLANSLCMPETTALSLAELHTNLGRSPPGHVIQA